MPEGPSEMREMRFEEGSDRVAVQCVSFLQVSLALTSTSLRPSRGQSGGLSVNVEFPLAQYLHNCRCRHDRTFVLLHQYLSPDSAAGT